MSTLHVQLRNTAPMPLDVTFTCQPGELVALVGPSGSGKTSVLRAIAGLLRSPSLAGVVRVGGDTWLDTAQGIHWSPQQRRAGLVFQSYALFPHLTAIQNVAVHAIATGVRGQFDAEIAALFARLGLQGLEQRLPAQLSGGQQQRVALARALMRLQAVDGTAQDGVLLLDEPFSAVDAPARQTLYRELAALRQHLDTPMVLVTHDLMEARRLADRVVIVDEGVSLQSGPPARVFAQPRNARVAELVGIQNLFQGRFHQTGAHQGQLLWSSDPHQAHLPCLRLTTLDKGRIVDGAHVRWVLAGESMRVSVWDAQSDTAGAAADSGTQPGADNVLDCRLQEVLELGETSLCRLVPAGLEDQTLTLTLSTAQLRGMAAGVGSRLAVRVAPQAIHIMPVRGLA